MKTTLSTLFLVAGSTGAAILKLLIADVDSLKIPGTGQAIRGFSRTCVQSAQRNDRDARRRTVALVTVGTVRLACSLLSGHVVDKGLGFRWFSKRLGSTKNDAVLSPSKPCSGTSGPRPGMPTSSPSVVSSPPSSVVP